MMATHEAPPAPPAEGQTRPLYCLRCDNPRPLGILSPGRYWTRTNGRTVLVKGGEVSVWCERCSKQHDIDLNMV